ncbi:MAG: hypothetical protein N2491_13825 [Negativicutes bacterium]|nr:hypothetical protein [Negativicutes bacterium]
MARTRWLTETALLTALITVTGWVKLPGILPGTEFQLSAPLAVAICAVFGFGKYITAGMLSSVIGLLLGSQNLLHILIAMVFRLTVGGMLAVFGTSWPVVTLAGPAGSILARVVLGGILGQAAVPLIIAALPGMVYTAAAAWPLTRLLARVKMQAERVAVHAVHR